MRIALNVHQFFDAHGAVFAHAADVVAPQVHEHDVLGAFFGILHKGGFDFAIFFFVVAARLCAGDRTVINIAPLHLHQHFRRTAHHVHVSQLEKIHVRRRIDHAQARGKFRMHRHWCAFRSAGSAPPEKYRPARIYAWALRTAARNCGLVKLEFTLTRPPLRGARCRGSGPSSTAPGALDFANRRIVFCAQASFAVREHVAHDPQTMLHVIEHHQAQIKHQDRIIEFQIVAPACGNAFDQPHHVVRAVSDRARNQRRQSRNAHGLVALDEFAQNFKRIAGNFLARAWRSISHDRPRERNTSSGFAPMNV